MTALELIAAVMASNLTDTAKLEAVRRIAGSEPAYTPVIYPVYPYTPSWPTYDTFPVTTWCGEGTSYSIPQHNTSVSQTVRLQ